MLARMLLSCCTIILPTIALAQDRSWILPSEHAEEAAVVRALDSPITLEFKGITLKQLARAIQEKTGVPVQLDKQAIADVGCSPETKIKFNPAGSTLRYALLRALRPFELTVDVSFDKVLITSRYESDSNLQRVVYDVTRLVRQADGTADLKSFIQMLTKTVESQSWDCDGGPGTMAPYQHPDRQGCFLSVEQTRGVLDQLEILLGTLFKCQQMPQQPALNSGLAPAATTATGSHNQPWIRPVLREGGEKVLQALDKPITINLQNLTLAEFARVIQKTAGLLVELSHSTLQDAEVGPETRISCEAVDAPLRNVLQQALKELELTFQIDYDGLLLTSQQSADYGISVILYDVTELTRSSKGKADFKTLIPILRGAIEPQSWDDVGGPGTMEPYQLPDQRGCFLVVSQTSDVFAEVERLLGALRTFEQMSQRQLLQAQPSKPQPPPEASEPAEEE